VCGVSSFQSRWLEELREHFPQQLGLSLPKEPVMNVLVHAVHRFIMSEDGPTAVEYAVMLGLIVVAIVTIVGKLATSVSGTFSTVSSAIS
jgi:pilus assembly protein Flp/PilA